MPYDRDKASECVTRLVGTRTSSHGGKCAVRRKGSLDEIPHVQRIRSVGIVRTEDARRIVSSLEVFCDEVHRRTIERTPEGRNALRG